jgi:protein-tyrosine phosphatase
MNHLHDDPVANAAMRAAHCLPPVRTSLTDPLRIDELVVGQADGRIGLCLCPGKRAGSLTGPRWERDLAADLEVIRRWRASAVLTLIEDHEFEELGVTQLGQQVRARGIDWHHLPIADYHPPDGRFEAAWSARGPELLARLHAGGRLLVHCRGGLGRAGTVAARILVESEVPAHEAIERVRRVRPGAIETREQRDHVFDLVRKRSVVG